MHDARAQVHAGADRGPARDDAPRTASVGGRGRLGTVEQVLDRQADAVPEPQRAAEVPRCERPVPEAGEDRRLDLGVRAPAARGGRVGHGGAAPAGVEVGEDRGRVDWLAHRRRAAVPVVGEVVGRAGRPPRHAAASSATVSPAAIVGRIRRHPSAAVHQAERAEERRQPLARRLGQRQERLARGVASRAGPSPASRPSPAPGSGRPGSWRAAAAASGRGGGAPRPSRRRARRGTSALISPGIWLRRHGDHAVAAHREDRQGRRVVAGEDGDVARPVAADHRDLLDVAAGLLDRHDARVLGEPQERVRLDVGAGPAGHVVDDDRQAALVRDRAEVRLEHPLVGLVVVGRDDERGVGAQGRGAAGGLDRAAGVVGARARDDRDPARRRARFAPVSTAISMQRSRSAADSVGDSPVVPTGTRPSMPAMTCQATSRR